MSGDGCRVIFHNVEGMPALTVAVPHHERAGWVRGMTLMEGRDGRPHGSLSEGDPNALRSLPFGPSAETGMRFAAHWADGKAVKTALRRWELGPPVDEATRVHAASLGAAAVRGAGFSDPFIDLIESLAAWYPLKLPFCDQVAFCGDGPLAVALRALGRRHPVLATARASWQGRVWSTGIVKGGNDPIDVGHSLLPRAKMMVIDSPEWSPKAPLTVIGPMDSERDCRGEGMYLCENEALGDMLEALPIDWLPRDPEGIDHFWAAARMLAVTKPLHLDLTTLAAPSKGDWASFVRRCRAAGPSERWMADELGRARHLEDPARHLADRVLTPLMASSGALVSDIAAMKQVRHDAWRAALRILYGGKGLPSVVRVAERWHAGLTAIERAIPSDADANRNEWPALLPPSVIEGIALAFLTTGAALREEGGRGPDAAGDDGLDHCVGAYRARAARGECHIVGLRRASDGARLATAEIRQASDGSVKVVQLRGARNASPPEGCAEALATYLAGPVPYVQALAITGDCVRQECGYDWRDGSLLREAVDAYDPFLPRDLRGDPSAILRDIRAGLASAGRARTAP